ncbi:MAG: hypothetical protein ACOCT9_01215, partial [archaeon]
MANSEVIDYKGLGNEAVKRYFDRMDEEPGKRLLEKIISDIVEREELNNEEIARVCQYANVKVFLRLYKATNDKTAEFEVADPKNIISDSNEELIPENPDLRFEDSYYIIKSEDEGEELNENEENNEIDINELKKLVNNMIKERSDLEIKLMERRPKLIKILKNKLLNNNPNLVAFSVKTAGGPQELIKT